MVFNSIAFLLFFPVVTLVYFLLSFKYRWIWLLLASCFFYGFFKWSYLLILVFTIIVDYFAGIWIGNSEGIKKKVALAASLIANIGVLAYFKYGNFIVDNINAVLFKLHEPTFDIMHILLPVGLSFHTFQAMSYTIEIYRGHQIPEKRFGIFALYVMFYPQLVAGPIERPGNVLPQFNVKHNFEYDRVVSGLRLMLWGMFKKVFIADRLSVFVDQVYDNPSGFQGLPLLIATLFFAFQIYCDFSGYTDIGLGAARVMGFNLMKNFDRPYISKSIGEFWNRWHISLSSWFRDYLYIPLGGNRVKPLRNYFNIMLVFLISGLWHGASWTFVIWGGLHGMYLVFERMTKEIQNKFYSAFRNTAFSNFLKTVITFSLVSFAWIFFRAKTFSTAKYISKNIFSESSHSLHQIYEMISPKDFYMVIIGIIILELGQYLDAKKILIPYLDTKPRWHVWPIYYLILFLIIFLGVFNGQQFIYFQF